MPYLKYNNKFIGVEPKFPNTVYANRDAGGLWEEVTLSPNDGSGVVGVLFKESNRQLCINPSGGFETRAPGTFGEWERLTFKDGVISRVGIQLQLEGYTPTTSLKVPFLKVNGSDFVDENNQRIALCGGDGSMDYRIWLDKKEDGLNPFAAENTAIGFQVRRVFMAGSIKQNFVIDIHPLTEPDYYGQLKPFVKYWNNYGVIPLLTINVDMQDCMPNASDRLNHWHRVNQELKGAGLSYLMSGGNQWSKNGFNPWNDVDDPGSGVIWSRGSDVEDTKTDPKGATASELHATRNSVDRAIMDATASPPDMRNHGATMVWMTEGIPFNDTSGPSEFEAWQFGRLYSTCWALAIFHDRQGQQGLMRKPGTVKKAIMWRKGFQLF